MILDNPVLFAWLLVLTAITGSVGISAVRSALREESIEIAGYLPPAEVIVMTILVTAIAITYANADPPTSPRLFFVAWIAGGFSAIGIACTCTTYRHHQIIAGLRRRNLSLIKRLVDKNLLEHEDTDEP